MSVLLFFLNYTLFHLHETILWQKPLVHTNKKLCHLLEKKYRFSSLKACKGYSGRPKNGSCMCVPFVVFQSLVRKHQLIQHSWLFYEKHFVGQERACRAVLVTSVCTLRNQSRFLYTRECWLKACLLITRICLRQQNKKLIRLFE